MAFLVAPNDAEPPAAGVAPPQHDLVAAVQVAAAKRKELLVKKKKNPPNWLICLLKCPGPHLGKPNHMTHDGDQLASKSLSCV